MAEPLTEYEIHTLEPEALTVGKLNACVRALREALYQAKLGPGPKLVARLEAAEKLAEDYREFIDCTCEPSERCTRCRLLAAWDAAPERREQINVSIGRDPAGTGATEERRRLERGA